MGAASADPKENAGLGVSAELAVVDMAAGSELGRGAKLKGRGDSVDCGNEVAAFGGSPNNEVVVLCAAEKVVVDVLAVFASNKGFGAISAASGFFSVASLVATSENGKPVVARGFSGTDEGFPNENGRLETLPLVVAIVVDAGLSSVVLPNENAPGAGIVGPLGLSNVNGAGVSSSRLSLRLVISFCRYCISGWTAEKAKLHKI